MTKEEKIKDASLLLKRALAISKKPPCKSFINQFKRVCNVLALVIEAQKIASQSTSNFVKGGIEATLKTSSPFIEDKEIIFNATKADKKSGKS